MDYEGFFKERLGALRAKGRYRIFADIERCCGRFPHAFDHRIGAEVTNRQPIGDFDIFGRSFVSCAMPKGSVSSAWAWTTAVTSIGCDGNEPGFLAFGNPGASGRVRVGRANL
jgi:hypothetical protein